MNKPLLLALLFIACIGGCDINDDFCSMPCSTDDTFDVSLPDDLSATDDTFDASLLGPDDFGGG